VSSCNIEIRQGSSHKQSRRYNPRRCGSCRGHNGSRERLRRKRTDCPADTLHQEDIRRAARTGSARAGGRKRSVAPCRNHCCACRRRTCRRSRAAAVALPPGGWFVSEAPRREPPWSGCCHRSWGCGCIGPLCLVCNLHPICIPSWTTRCSRVGFATGTRRSSRHSTGCTGVSSLGGAAHLKVVAPRRRRRPTPPSPTKAHTLSSASSRC
jgi:hypothetical protein